MVQAALEISTDVGARFEMPPPDPIWLIPLARISKSLNYASAVLSAIILTLTVAYVVFEIVLRAFSKSTFMLDTLVGHGVAAIIFLSMPLALERGAMIRVGYFIKNAGSRIQWALELWTTLASLAFLCFIAKYQWTSVVKDYQRGTTTQHYVPILNWIPGSIFLTGLFLASLFLVVRLLRQCAIGTPPDTSEAAPLD